MSEAEKTKEDYFSWEASYSKIWSVILENETDSIQNSITRFHSLQHNRLAKNIQLLPGLKRGLIRNFLVIIEASSLSNDTDLYPNRLQWIFNRILKFSRIFLEQNPLCQIGIIITKDGIAEKVSDFTNDISSIENSLSKANEGSGDASFKNALDLALSCFGNSPGHISKEVLFIQSGLSSCDSENIQPTILRFKEQRVKVSFISLLGQVYYSEMISKTTGGNYDVVLNEDHFFRLIMKYIQPPPMLVGDLKSLGYLVQMGFPRVNSCESEYLCICHSKTSKKNGFACPRCDSRICNIPTECPICQLTLISSSHLARSYHHLFPVPPFVQVKQSDIDAASSSCFSCLIDFSKSALTVTDDSVYCMCRKCTKVFCSSCDGYIHENLHNCPGCLLK